MFGESLTYEISMAAGTSLRIPRKMFRVLDKKTKDGHGSFVEFGATFWFTLTQEKFDPHRDNFAVFLGKCTKLDYVCRFGEDGKPFAFGGDREEQAASARSLKSGSRTRVGVGGLQLLERGNGPANSRDQRGSHYLGIHEVRGLGFVCSKANGNRLSYCF